MVIHRCDNPPCVNPEHLRIGTNADNMRDMGDKGRSKFQKSRFLGEEHGMSTMTEARVRELRMARASGATYDELAVLFGISRSNAHSIALRKTWAHVK